MGFELILEKVNKYYHLDGIQVHALQNISLCFGSDEFVAIVGPSGSGKTTLLNLIGGLDCPTEGVVSINHVNISLIPDYQLTMLRNKTIGFIFQNFNLIPILTAFENVEYPLLMNSDVPKKERRERVQIALEQVGLTKYQNHRPNQLSGGQRQRIAIARALVVEPNVVLADEPTANLDSKTGEAIIELMLQLHQKKHCTFIFSTHDFKIMRHAKKLIHLEDGKILKIEEPSCLLK